MGPGGRHPGRSGALGFDFTTGNTPGGWIYGTNRHFRL